MNGLKNGLQEGLISGLNNGLAEGLTNGLTNGLFVNEYPFDIDANKFLLAANINNIIIKNRINKLVIYLKAAGIWNKMKAIYPFVGGTATTHKFNLKDSRDLDAAFRLQFFGGGTHSENGYQPNGTNSWANTYFTPSLNGMILNSAHISYYSRTNTSSYMVEMGNYDNVTNSSTLLLLRDVNTASIRMNNLTVISYTNTDSLGLHISNRTASNVITGWKNGIKRITSTIASTSLPANVIYIGAFRDGIGTNYYSSKQCAFASIGDGLSDAEAINFYNIVQDFQRGLNRAV